MGILSGGISRDPMVRAAIKIAERAKCAPRCGISYAAASKPSAYDANTVHYELPWELVDRLTTQELAQHVLKMMKATP